MRNELYQPKTADAEYDSITCATRRQSWINVPSYHIERRLAITIVQPNAQHPFSDETFYDLFILELWNHFLHFMSNFLIYHSAELNMLYYCPFV